MSRAVAALVIAVLLGCSRPPRPAPVPPRAARPRLVVVIVIDQLPAWIFERDAPHFVGGLRRMLREGARVRAAELPYAIPFTAPGHATIATGAVPAVHGIIGNQWYRRDQRRVRSAEFDPGSPIFGLVDPEPVVAADGASARALRVDGIAEALRRGTSGRGHSVAVALKARAAVLVAGRRPDLAIWYEPAAGGMTTSRAYAEAVPSWLVDHARADPAERFLGRTWSPLDPARLRAITGVADDRAGEAQAIHGLDATFPHQVTEVDAIAHTPFADELVFGAATAAIDALRLGADEVPDLLAISLNAHDYVGHAWGPDSWEVLDLMLRLDAALGSLFDALDRRLGRQGWAVVLTSDHGATPLVEAARVVGARRIPTSQIIAAAEAAIARHHGPGPWVAAVVSNEVYLTAAALALSPAERRAAVEDAARAITALPNVTAGSVEAALARCAVDAMALAVCNAVVPGESGELYVVADRGSLVSDYETGTHHDAPSDDNRLVPILVMAPGVVPQIVEHGSLLAVAPTVAALLGVAPPPAANVPALFGLAASR